MFDKQYAIIGFMQKSNLNSLYFGLYLYQIVFLNDN